MDKYGKYETWEDLLAHTLYANPPVPLAVTVHPPVRRRERYLGMSVDGIGATDTRRYLLGRDRRRRSEVYGRMMVLDLVAIHFDIPTEWVRDSDLEIGFTWSTEPWGGWFE